MTQVIKRTTYLALILFSIAFIFGCDNSVSVEDTPYPTDQQVSTLEEQNLQKHKTPQIIEGEYIVIIKDIWNRQINEQTAQQVRELRNRVLTANRIERESILHTYDYAVKGFAAKLTDQQFKALQKNPQIERITPNVMLGLATTSTPKSSSENEQINLSASSSSSGGNWGVARVGGPLDGSGKRAWILDTGIDLNHSDLNVDTSNSASFIANESANDGNGHGTHVAGIIASTGNNTNVVGVAKGATVVPIKVCYDEAPSQFESQCPASSIINGIDYISIRAQPDDIVNLSFGGYDSSTNIDDAVINAANNGVRFTIAAGNSRMHAKDFTPARVNHQNTWTLSAMDNSDVFASFSNYGNPPIDFAAPGVDIFSLWKNGGTETISGTSMSAPHLAGLLLTVPNDISIDGYVSNDPSSSADPIAAYTPLSVTITGPTHVDSGQQSTWSANVQNTDGSVSYAWYTKNDQNSSWSSTGQTSSTLNWTFHNNSSSIQFASVRVDVTDSSDQDSYTHSVTVSPGCEPGVIFC